MKKPAIVISLLTLIVWITVGCATNQEQVRSTESKHPQPPQALRPVPEHDLGIPSGDNQPMTLINLTEPGAVVWGVTERETIDSTSFYPQILLEQPGSRNLRKVKEILPAHTHNVVLPHGPANRLTVAGLLAQPRTRNERLFPAIGQTGWIPPDPALAVGPTHIVTTVNQSIAFYTRDGVQEFFAELNSYGSPGFFEPVGAGGFTFDPKCFYDHLAQRFVVVAPEVYDDDEAWIAIAVSDDSDPHGTWYKYRTDAVITVGDTTYWWDYPGFGYDADAYYVTSNLFGLNQSGWGGVGFRVFDKASMLNGDPVQYATLRDGGAASVQVAQHFGDNPAPFYVSLASNSQLRIHAITDPLTNPQLVSTTVSVPYFDNPFDAPTSGGNSIWLIDHRIMNAHWRDGNLYAAHHISSGSRNFARWYHVNTNNWPDSGSPSYVQAGNIDAGGDLHTWFPAIYSNTLNDVAMVFGASSADDRISINTTGRLAGDPAGTMGAITEVLSAPVDGGGRWGDYYDIAIDPLDDMRFWIIGEYPESFGWATWIGSFVISDGPMPVAVPDNAGDVFSDAAVVLDVMSNDYHTGGLEFEISTFDAASVNGGTVTLSVGTGPDGRDELIYTPPQSYTGPDSFNYTITDTADVDASTVVSAQVYDIDEFRDPDEVAGAQAGIAVAYYQLSSPTVLPDFSTLSPYHSEVVEYINYSSTSGDFAGSGREDEVGAVYEGFVNVPAHAHYSFYCESDDGSKLYIGGQLVVDNDGLHGMSEASGTIALKQGTHRIRIEFFENGGGAGLIVRIAGGEMAKQVIPIDMWLHEVPCPGDLNGDLLVDLSDLAELLGNYGQSEGMTYQQGDLDGDGDVDLSDLAALLGVYGAVCE